uniref:Uncharacterized protein n=1 Tax=Oryza nivara TaxID=4536 RepID=A0A0E0I864_ORYNI
MDVASGFAARSRAKSNNRRLFHVGDIGRIRKQRNDTPICICILSFTFMRMVSYDVGAFVQLNLLLLKGAFMRIWEAGSKWKAL